MNISGVVEIDLDRDRNWQDEESVGAPAFIPDGVRARIYVGNRRYLTSEELRRVASLTCAAASVEVVGAHPAAIADLVRFLRDRQREWAAVA